MARQVEARESKSRQKGGRGAVKKEAAVLRRRPQAKWRECVVGHAGERPCPKASLAGQKGVLALARKEAKGTGCGGAGRCGSVGLPCAFNGKVGALGGLRVVLAFS